MSATCTCSLVIILTCVLCRSVTSLALRPRESSFKEGLTYMDDEQEGTPLPGWVQLLARMIQQRQESQSEDISSASVELSRSKETLRNLLHKFSKLERPVTPSALNLFKRGNEDYGAMPPLNELCRVLQVKCG
ncbi:hypothetical protein Bpfe_002628 [Biomphalaria pfeifferi]|uniref:Uncharacterized protein n=1 Tax=Biomphalaria pfeifferi TaxID=112525 RepID=A0AAD8FJZ2_BIOPF|nr:hypothetical protein Bpfe_002628 [Biomphalaria pfeifferi]